MGLFDLVDGMWFVEFYYCSGGFGMWVCLIWWMWVCAGGGCGFVPVVVLFCGFV